MIIINPQFKNYKQETINGSKTEYLLSLCRYGWKLREDAWDLHRKSVIHYINDEGDCVIETLSDDNKIISDYVKGLIADGIIDEHGVSSGFSPAKRKIAKIRHILESEELSADAMVSEIVAIIALPPPPPAEIKAA